MENTIYIWSSYSTYQASIAFSAPLSGIYTRRGTLSGQGATIPKQGSELSALLYLDCNRNVTHVTFRLFARAERSLIPHHPTATATVTSD